jgi:hypothetical protein
MRKDVDHVVYIPKEDVLPDRVENTRGSGETQRGNGEAMTNRLSEVDITATRAGVVVSYGSEDAFHTWWPSWF